jgi:hypothetical protein
MLAGERQKLCQFDGSISDGIRQFTTSAIATRRSFDRRLGERLQR